MQISSADAQFFCHRRNIPIDKIADESDIREYPPLYYPLVSLREKIYAFPQQNWMFYLWKKAIHTPSESGFELHPQYKSHQKSLIWIAVVDDENSIREQIKFMIKRQMPDIFLPPVLMQRCACSCCLYCSISFTARVNTSKNFALFKGLQRKVIL